MRPFLLALLLLASLPAAVLAQEAPLPFEIEIEEVAWPDPAAIPALHSFAWAEHDGKWLLVAGRTDGLHGFGADPFPVASANDAVWVVDPAAGTAWSQPLDGLSTPLRESLMVTNAQYHQEGETLYLIGGYGHSTEAGTMITFPTLTAIDVPELIAAVTGGTDLGPHFRQIEDERMAVTGGELRKLPLFGQYLLIGGQRFDGEYSGPGSEFEQEYLTSIRAFDIDDGAGLAVIGWAEFFTDPDGLHRRDLTVAPVAWPDASVGTAHGFGIYGGVFRPAQDLPILEPAFVYHTDVPEYALADGFEQQLNHYTCPAVALVDPATARTFTTFFGGMGLYYEDDDTGEVVADPRVPFIREVSTLTTEQATPIAETLQPFEMPGFLGTNAAFIPATDVPQYENGAFKLDELPAEWVTVGTIYGGLEATTPNPGRFLDGGTSGPTNRAFHVRVRSLVSSPAEPGTEAAAVTVEAPYPNPFADAATVALRLRQSERVRIEVLDVLGRRVALLHDGPLAGDTRHAFRFDGGALPAGLYLVRVTGETFGEVRPVTRVR